MSDKTITVSNYTMEQYVETLKNFLDRKDIIGYAAARNTRKLNAASFDHARIKLDLLNEYGTPKKDEYGNDTNELVLTSDDENFELVKKRLDISGNTKHDVIIYTITYEDVINELTGNEILLIDWMIEED